MTRLKTNRCFASALAALAVPLFAPGAIRADEVTDWHEILAPLSATVSSVNASRDAALMSSSVFDAVNGIERRYAPIHVTATAPRGASKRAAAVQAAYVVLLARYPGAAGDLNAKRTASMAAIPDGESKNRGVAWGDYVANAILTWRSTDGFSPPPPPYFGGDAIGQWRSSTPGVGLQFATMRPWGIQAPDQFLPPGPPALDSAQYLADYDETKLMGSRGSALRTAEQTEVSLFWDAARPVALFDRAAIRLATAHNLELSDNARLMAMLNLAIADATIACWNAKYDYEFWRPITAIRLGNDDGVDSTAGDPTWTPLIVTPSHPEYPSGHSCASTAASTVLAAFFGDDTPFFLEARPGWVRTYPNFAAAQSEVADARVFAGIHFRTACNDAVATGQSVGTYLLANMMQRLHGEGE
jgi:hypothetical protein